MKSFRPLLPYEPFDAPQALAIDPFFVPDA
jgi:hypothetical protein